MNMLRDTKLPGHPKFSNTKHDEAAYYSACQTHRSIRLFESRALDEALVPGTPINGNRFALEDAATATQTILVYVRKTIDKLVAIGHEASLLNEQIHLLPKDKPGPHILHGHSKICTQKKGPPVCVFDRTEIASEMLV